jgi:hypothetical protein
MRSWAVLAVVLVATGVAGCDGSEREAMSRDAQVYVVTIRDVVAEEPPPPDPDVLPVVYVIGVGEEDIAADIQADVAAELKDEVDVRFADARAEAVLADDEEVPVRDHGVLVAVGALAPESDDADAVDVEVEVYRSEVDWSKLVVTIGRQSSQWTVTSTSVVPPGDA